MQTEYIILALCVLGGLGLLFGVGLAVASKKLAVPVDERVEKIRDLLPGANCGGCGFPGCDGFAAAVADMSVKPGECPVCSKENILAIGEILGIKVVTGPRKFARLRCLGTSEVCANIGEYSGPADCKAAAAVLGGFKGCRIACLGLGTCANVCVFGAIKVPGNGLVEIDKEKCTGCGTCAANCPKFAIDVVSEDQTTFLSCRNTGFGKAVSAFCKAGCIGCGACAKNCAAGAIEMVDKLPRFDYSKCTHCGVCATKCRPGCITALVINNDE